MTPDERLVLQTTITLHGFELRERWLSDRGYWSPFLLGRQLEYGLQEVIMAFPATGMPDKRRYKLTIATRHQPLYWFKLTDPQLEAFHDTVVSTC